MFKLIALSFLLLSSLNASCGKGCLRCKDKSATDTTKVCQLCDIPNNYYMKTDNSCALTDLTNCQVIKHDNTCSLCNSNYFINNGKCVAVDVAKKVTNCSHYDANQACSICS